MRQGALRGASGAQGVWIPPSRRPCLRTWGGREGMKSTSNRDGEEQAGRMPRAGLMGSDGGGRGSPKAGWGVTSQEEDTCAPLGRCAPRETLGPESSPCPRHPQGHDCGLPLLQRWMSKLKEFLEATWSWIPRHVFTKHLLCAESGGH